MRKQNKVIVILKDKSGMSFLFVLGIMMMLMAIGVSVLVAASANTGIVLEQHEHSQIMILDESVHKNILFALQREAEPSEPVGNLLSTQLAYALYQANDPKLTGYYSADGLGNIVIGEDEIVFGNGLDITDGDIKVEKITLSFPEQGVYFTDQIAAFYVEGELCPREPRTATVDATMVVTVEINARGKMVTSRATYEYTGGELSDDPDALGHTHDDVTTDEVFEMAFLTDGYGEWRLVEHGNMES